MFNLYKSLFMRKLFASAKLKALCLIVAITLSSLCKFNLFAQNAIVTENSLPGNPASEWDISGAGDLSIQGFATDISVNKGETVHFKIKTNASAYTIDIYRIGYYQGNGARKVGTGVITATLPQTQPADLYDPATGLTDCGNWNESAHWDVPANAVSGVYIAKLTRTNNGGSSHIVFIVRDDASHSDLSFQTSDATWQAYNNYGGNSLYVGSTSFPGGHAAKVSYNRPFLTRNGGGGGGAAEDWIFNAEYPMIRWLERNGYDVTYFTDVDAARRGNLILNHKVYLSVGHDEYWSGEQRANVEAARNAGVNLGFFCGNGIYWKTRWENSTDVSNTPYRTLVCYKEGTLGENQCNTKCDPLTNVWTGLWRDGCEYPDADGCKPENALSGQISWDDVAGAIKVPDTYKNFRFWRNTSIATLGSGQTATLSANTLGYEWDWYQYPNSYPDGRVTMSSTTLNSHLHNLSLYRHSSGALVFGAGTVQWSWGLDGVHDRGSSTPDARMQQATVNLFADMAVQPGSLQAGLVAATNSTDAQTPATVITSPANNANIAVGTSVTIRGTASDNNVVAGVEVSVDGGTTWQQATGTTNWTYAWTPSTSGTVTIKTRGFDDIGNLEAAGEGPASNVVTVNITGSQTGCPCTIFQSTDVPNISRTNDGTSIELGVKFQSSVNGYITGIRFYKGANTTGTHTGHLWTSNGTLLASATFSNETASGWQQVLFGTPVAVNANTTYVASFFSTSGDYAATDPFFTQAVVNTPLKGLANGEDGPNGVYIYAGTSTFPTQTFNATNYYVDVVFNTSVGPDVTPPQVTHTAPASNATNVNITTSVIVDFNESIDPTTVNTSTFILQDQSNNIIPANVTYNSGLDEATLMPASPLSYSSTYKVTLKGGSTNPRIKDVSGNALAFDYTWNFTTANPPPPLPNDGPGGPILVISSASNPFSRYPVEILRAEGLNEFAARDISNITSTVLDSFDVVIVGDIPLSASMVTLLTNWTNAGGTLIAFHPDAQLGSLLGLTRVGTSLSDKYLLINTASGPGTGLVNQTIQYHGSADLYALNGATSLATLYSNANTATSNPAVTMRNVGSNGGVAVAFSYDLARSIVYTRQGNPAWAGQKRDGQINPKRSDDMFFGDASFDPQPDWIDLNKVAIPQADEQQHLLGNIINNYNLHNYPLPRFWFLPNGFKAAIVMTGDDHGSGGTVGRFNQYLSLSSSNTAQSVLDWTAIRGTSYVYPGTPITDAQTSSFQSQGFEIGIHLNTGCSDWTSSSWNADYDDQIAQLDAQLPSMTSPATNRTHCIAWSDWASQPKLELSKGIRLDVNYYYWPGSWLQNRSGMFTGSGMPMRFADMDGSLIDCYQVTTQMPDESDEVFPGFVDQLLDKATGTEGYYGVFCANMHTDAADSPGSDAIISSAQNHNIPVISAKQMLTWLDGRNNSSFKSISWNVNQLSFSIDTGVGSHNLQAMVPVTSAVGPLLGIKLNGVTVNYTTQTIKGITYAFFNVTKGNYKASYGTDNAAPGISNILATPHADGTAAITWKTNELSNSKVDYNIDPNPLTLSSNDINLVLNHSITLSGLTQGATYHFRVTSADGAANSATSPTPPDSLSFTMPTTNCTLSATALAGTISCNGGTTTVTVSATGGTLPYTGTGTFTAGSGTHDYIVTDKNGCSSTATITIGEPAPIGVTASPGTITCNGGSTSVVVTATGGTGAYSGTGTFNNVVAGTYTYNVTDANSCAGSTTITVTQPATITFGTPTVTNVGCNGNNNGKIVISATGGTGNITYTISPNIGTQSPSGTFNNLTAGSYTITATDANGCTKTSNNITVSQSAGITFGSATVTNISCNGGNNGKIVTSANGGTGTITYTISPNIGTQSPSGTFNNLTAGNYTITATDGAGCSNTSNTITVTQPTAIVFGTPTITAVTCNGGNNGKIVISASGGTGTITFSISPIAGTQSPSGTFNGLTAGTYTITATDANACTKTRNVTVTQPQAITVTATVDSAIVCSGGTTSVTVSATGGTGPYNGTGKYLNQSSGSHTYTVVDANGCTKTKTISITNGGTKPSQPGTISGQNINICGTNTFTFSISSVTGATSYTWTAPAGLSIVSNSGTSIGIKNANSAFTTSGILSVKANNSCGSSAARNLTLFAVAQDPGTITGSTSVAAKAGNVKYNVTNRSGITFNWSVPTGATITSGQGTNVIRVKFGTTSGNVSVFLSNTCGQTATSSLAVTVGGALAAQSVQTITAVKDYLKIYPNPTSSVATLEFNAEKGSKYQIVVTDVVGKPIITTSGVAGATANTLQLDMNKHAAGMYLVTLITAEGAKTAKLYKEK